VAPETTARFSHLDVRRRNLAVIHVAIDAGAVDLLDVVGEELGDIFIGRPVHGNAEVVAVLGLELGLVLRIGEPRRIKFDLKQGSEKKLHNVETFHSISLFKHLNSEPFKWSRAASGQILGELSISGVMANETPSGILFSV
jgi:hypothetical protein